MIAVFNILGALIACALAAFILGIAGFMWFSDEFRWPR